METIFVKFGGSTITDKTKQFTAREDIIRQLVREIAEAKKKTGIRLVVGHGSGSFGHTYAHQYQVHKGITGPESWKGYALTHDAAARLNRIVVKIFLEEGVNAVSMQPSASGFNENGKMKSMSVAQLEKLLDAGLVPVVFGDMMLDEKMGCSVASTEEVFTYLAPKLKVDRMIFVGLTDGVYTADPLKDPNAKLIEHITPANFEQVRKGLGGSHGVDVTGGMLDKVEKILGIMKQMPYTKAALVSGEKPGRLKSALLGENIACTRITAR